MPISVIGGLLPTIRYASGRLHDPAPTDPAAPIAAAAPIVADPAFRAAPTWVPLLMRPGYVAVRENLVPFVGILLTAALLVLAFYAWPAFNAAATRLATFKSNFGIVGSAVAASIAGGLLPEVARSLSGRTGNKPRRQRVGNLAFDLVFFAIMGAVVDRLYHVQILLHGDRADVLTAARKMLTDQLVFTPLIAVPGTLLAYRWRELGYDGKALRKELGWDWFMGRVLPLQLPNWVYWVPMNLLTYGLPTAAQFLLYLGALAAWSLLLVVIAGHRHADAGERK